MPYSDKIKLLQLPPFAELYHIQIGEANYYYTSYSKDVLFDFDDNVYFAAPIHRGDFSNNDKLFSQRVTVSVPLTDWVLAYIANAPAELVKLKIYRVFQDGSGDFIKLFDGVNLDITISENTASIIFESLTQVLRSKLPRVLFQSRCNHRLFDSGCTLNADDFKTTATVIIDGSDLVSATFDTFPDGYFIQGQARKDGDCRLITNHVGDRITLQVPFDARLENGETVDVYPGDDQSADTCRDKFDNFNNFLGFPHIPSSNPVIWGFK